jgi:hypothetical protein
MLLGVWAFVSGGRGRLWDHGGTTTPIECHKLEKLSKQVNIASARIVDLENDELASVSVN